MVEHVAIPDDGRHEPKGVGTAVNRSVYMANGSGSGSWQPLPTPTFAQGFVNNNAAATVFAALNTPIALNYGGAFISSISDGITLSGAGQFQYIGTLPRVALVSADMRVQCAGGVPMTYDLFVTRNGAVVPSSRVRVILDGTNPLNISVSSLVPTVVTNDTFSIRGSAVTALTDLVVVDHSLKVIGW